MKNPLLLTTETARPLNPEDIASDFYRPDGLTLRDYFAAKAPPAPNYWYTRNDSQLCMDVLDERVKLEVLWNYTWADAMLAQRSIH